MAEDIPVAGSPIDPRLLSGKRRSPRKRRTLIVDIGEPGGTHYQARTVDLSRGGMLLEFVDDKLRAPSDPAEMLGFATKLMTMFPTGMETSFGSGAVRTHASVVRLVGCASTASPILLGCRFDTPLTPLDCRLLGLDVEGDETDAEAAPAEAPSPAFDDLMGFLKDPSRSWKVDLTELDAIEDPTAPPSLSDDDLASVGRRGAAARPALGSPMSPPWAQPGEVVAHLFPVGSAAFGPRYRGRLVHVDGGVAWVDLPLPPTESDPFGWAAGLGAVARLVALCEGRVLWETVAAVARFEVGPDEHVRATLRPDRGPTPELTQALGSPVGAR